MTVKEARKIVVEYADNTRKVTEEEFFMFTEAMDYLINEEHKPQDMMYSPAYSEAIKKTDKLPCVHHPS